MAAGLVRDAIIDTTFTDIPKDAICHGARSCQKSLGFLIASRTGLKYLLVLVQQVRAL